MREIERPKNGWNLPREPKTEFTKEELSEILDLFLQYKPLFDESSTIELDYDIQKAPDQFTKILYKYNITDRFYNKGIREIRNQYGDLPVRELSKKKLDFSEVMTLFTFIHRADHFSFGFYEDCIKDKTYYNLLCRLEEIKNEL